tara:strand:+ start:1518 stop:1754 length:237 start_codon:yes stop_codon:yes gene_type:complete
MSEQNKLNKEQKKELQSIVNDIIHEAKELKLDYEENESDMSGSVVHVHENSPFLDTHLEGDEPLYSGSGWTRILKNIN